MWYDECFSNFQLWVIQQTNPYSAHLSISHSGQRQTHRNHKHWINWTPQKDPSSGKKTRLQLWKMICMKVWNIHLSGNKHIVEHSWSEILHLSVLHYECDLFPCAKAPYCYCSVQQDTFVSPSSEETWYTEWNEHFGHNEHLYHYIPVFIDRNQRSLFKPAECRSL